MLYDRYDDHAHSEFSNILLIDSINRIPEMMITAHNLGYKGITLTDHECLCGHLKWLQTERELKEKGVIPTDFKCGLGNEIYLVEDRNNIEKYWHYILIAKNDIGHRALRELSSIAWYYSYNSRGITRVPTQMNELENIVKKYPNSLIATNACIGGFIGGRVLQLIQAEKERNADLIFKYKSDIDKFMKWNINLFGDDFYIELAAGTSKDQIAFNQRIGMIAKAYNRKIIIGSDAHYLTAKERPVHKAYLNSKDGDREVDEFYWDAHFMTEEECIDNLKSSFTEQEYAEMCKNSMEIYNKIGTYNLTHTSIIPEVNVKDYPKKIYASSYPIINSLFQSDNIQERYWINECINELTNKELMNDIYLERIETEANVIKIIGEKLGDCLFKYFNTFQHYINLFWDCGSIVGPGRGSSVCFLSNYLLGITQLDPVKWNLPYWRFLNEERIELPKLYIGQYKIGEHTQWCLYKAG